MAHAPAELRDPTAPPGKPPPGRADDLLSQLAGKEIDRLLADADLDGESSFGAATPSRVGDDRGQDRTSTPAGHDRSPNDGPASTRSDVATNRSGEVSGRLATDEDDAPALTPEAADALAGAGDTLSKELDQVFDRQLDDAAGDARGGGNRGAARPDAGSTAAPAAEVRPSAESQADGVAGPAETPAASVAAGEAASDSAADHDTEHPIAAATAAAVGGPDEAQGSASAAPASADGVGDLLSRLSAGERPPPPEEGSIVAAAADPTADHAAHASPDPHSDAESSTASAAGDAGHREHAPDREHASHAADTPHPSTDAHHCGHAADAPHADATAHPDHAATAAPAADGAAHDNVIHLPAAPPGPSLIDRALGVLAVPLDPFPDEVRDAVGKVAIITAVNGVAVLAYVMFFRG